jgi:sterol desaturase/sphingolipid hydroxylase (fatty acid hydroxylase superfamily)
MLILEFVAIFLIMLIFGYFLPAGFFYLLYHVRHNRNLEARRIQHRLPVKGQIWREIRLSMVTVLIFAMLGTVLFELYRAGYTSIYWRVRDYPLWYLPASLIVCLFLHDTYFYWTHRFMHLRWVFKYAHVGHHRSVTPTPWAIFAFQPLEAVIQFVGIMLLVIFLPLHPVVLLAFFSLDSLVNTAGHTGFELVPKRISRSRLFAGFNTVRHHDTHHTNMKVNFGSFFNVWDRWMGTNLPDEAANESELKQTQSEIAAAQEKSRAANLHRGKPAFRRGQHPA